MSSAAVVAFDPPPEGDERIRTAVCSPGTDAVYVRSRDFELWQRVEGGVNDAATWMVWEIGPDTGGEHWFNSEYEARTYIAERWPKEAAP